MRASELFDWPSSLREFEPFFPLEAFPWAWLPAIAAALGAFDFAGAAGLQQFPAGVAVSGPVYLHPSVRLPAFCVIHGPAWIGPEVEIRPGAYVRGNVIVGAGSVLGNSCEYKNCLLLEQVETPHYNYVGDSILGNRAHLGAGVICANLRLARDEVVVRIGSEIYPTGLRKLGAMLGDGAEAACNSVLQPGTILGRRAAVLNQAFGGYLPAGQMAVASTQARIIRRRDADAGSQRAAPADAKGDGM